MIIYTQPEKVDKLLVISDNGTVMPGIIEGTHYKVTIPSSIPNENGARLIIELKDYTKIDLHGILRTTPVEEFFPDVYWLQKKEVIIVEPPVEPPVDTHEEIEIINNVYKNGNFNLATKNGCGQFTEACCTALHIKNSNRWGHVRKFGAQNQYNGHAVDAIQVLAGDPYAEAGIYDIIVNSESVDARPAFNFAGPVEPTLWYYPA